MVVVFIPPPVDPGEAPINIKIIKINNPEFVKLPRGYVLNPAVPAEALKKNAPSQDTSSVTLSNIVPVINKAIVVVKTTLVCRLNFLNLVSFVFS